MTTVQQAIEAKGLKVFDTALPQDWYDKFFDATGVNPAGRIVWCYDTAIMFGEPVAIDDEAAELLAQFEQTQRQ